MRLCRWMKTGLGSCKLNNKHTRAPVSSGYHVILVVPFCSLLPKFSFSVATETALALLLETVTEAGLFLARPKLDDLAMVSCSGKDIVGRERAEVCGELSCMAFSGWPHGINRAHVSRARRRGMGFYTSAIPCRLLRWAPTVMTTPKVWLALSLFVSKLQYFLDYMAPRQAPSRRCGRNVSTSTRWAIAWFCFAVFRLFTTGYLVATWSWHTFLCAK
jgi:hypothetical protein